MSEKSADTAPKLEIFLNPLIRKDFEMLNPSAKEWLASVSFSLKEEEEIFSYFNASSF